MVERHWLGRRTALRLGLGAIAGLGCSAFARHRDRQEQNQAFDDLLKNLSALGPNRSLKHLAARKNLIYGATSGYRILSSDTDFAACFIDECEILVPENDLKWKALRPSPEQFDFTAADWLLNFTQTHNLKIRGHTLVWHRSLPG